MRLPLFALTAGLALASGHAAAQQQPVVAEAPLRAHLSFLADDLFEGRGTGQRGGDLAVRYLETQAAVMGLKPLADGGYRQSVKIEGSKLLPGSVVRFTAGDKVVEPALAKDIVYGTAGGRAEVKLDAPLVFVGYGVRAPEERWDDYKGVDVKGKILVIFFFNDTATTEEP